MTKKIPLMNYWRNIQMTSTGQRCLKISTRSGLDVFGLMIRQLVPRDTSLIHTLLFAKYGTISTIAYIFYF